MPRPSLSLQLEQGPSDFRPSRGKLGRSGSAQQMLSLRIPHSPLTSGIAAVRYRKSPLCDSANTPVNLAGLEYA